MKGIKVTVTDPETENEGRRDAFTTYLVSTEKTAVRRRYSDFRWLYARLQTELPGAIVPIIPHKIAVGRKFEPSFVETRRRHLQFFMNAVVDHEELQRSPSMTPFMVDKFGIEFETGKKNVEAANPTSLLSADEETPSTAKKMSNMFAKAGVLMGVKAGKKTLAQTPQEQQFAVIHQYITKLESQVHTLVQASEAMTQSTGHMAKIVKGMNQPLHEWRNGYQEYTKVSDDVCDMMGVFLEFTNDYSQLMDCKYRDEQLEFEDVMIRLGGEVKAFKVALKQRKHWQVALTTTTQQIKVKGEQIAKATFNLKPPELTAKLSTERSEYQRKAEREKAKLDECTTRFLKEVNESKQRLESQLKEAFCHYAKIQIAYTNRINNAWGQLLPYVDDTIGESTNENRTTTNTEISVVSGDIDEDAEQGTSLDKHVSQSDDNETPEAEPSNNDQEST